MLTLLLILPLSPIHETRCEVGERNELYTCEGDLQFRQQIWWSDGVVADWRMLPRCGEPEWDWARREWSNTWVEDGRIYRVRFPVLKRSMTFTDPEVQDRERLPREHRRGLR